MIVISLNHEDNSGCYAIDNVTKEKLYYKWPPFKDYSRENVVPFRKICLDKRLEEIKEIFQFLRNTENIKSLDN